MSIDFSKALQNVKGLTADSRKVKEGYLFAALPGVNADGRDFISVAIEQGATHILLQKETSLHGSSAQSQDDHTHKACDDGVAYIYVDNPRRAFAKLAAAFYHNQPETIAAVTGTNGKTSVVTFTEQLWQAANHKASSLGTLKGNLTTPDPVALHAELSKLAKDGVSHVAVETSSHGLDQYRADGMHINVAGFTNLSHDHLDYHGTFEKYLAAKSRLFSEVLSENGTAVLNADIPEFEKLKTICDTRGIKILTYGHKAKDLKIISAAPTAHGQKLELGIFGKHTDLELPLVGEFQIMNALCALGLCIATDPKNKMKYIDALKTLKGARGRLQLVSDHPKNAAVYVDYAHTPDALENVLKALRPHTKGKLVCIFGCGGDRDKAKRPVMGKIANTYSDMPIITDDNPRSEDPASIRDAIQEAAPNAIQIASRKEAIHSAIQSLNSGDVLLIAGKGHEQGQVFADRTDPFDDVTEAQIAIQNLINENAA